MTSPTPAISAGYYCNKCGAFPDTQQHDRPNGYPCHYLAVRVEVFDPSTSIPCAHSWRDFGALGGRAVVWCSKCDALAFTGNEQRATGVAPSHGWLGTTENVSDADAAQSVLTGRTIPEIQADIAATMRKVEDAARGVTVPDGQVKR